MFGGMALLVMRSMGRARAALVLERRELDSRLDVGGRARELSART